MQGNDGWYPKKKSQNINGTACLPSFSSFFLSSLSIQSLKVLTFVSVCAGLIPYRSYTLLRSYRNTRSLKRVKDLLRGSVTLEQFIIKTPHWKPSNLFVKSNKDNFILLSCIIPKYSSSLNMYTNAHTPMNTIFTPSAYILGGSTFSSMLIFHFVSLNL